MDSIDNCMLTVCRLHKADKKLILYAAAAHGLLASWAVFLRLTAGQQPLVACKLLFNFPRDLSCVWMEQKWCSCSLRLG